MAKIGQAVQINSGRYEGVLGEIIRIFPAGELCEEEVYQIRYAINVGTTMGQFKKSELIIAGE